MPIEPSDLLAFAGVSRFPELVLPLEIYAPDLCACSLEHLTTRLFQQH